MRASGQLAIVVMGVSGAGKSTVAVALADRLGREVLDADDLHPPGNVVKLRAGQPLTDTDREPWLDAVADWIDAHPSSVIACSALRRTYRDRLRAAGPPLFFVHLDPPAAELAVRVGHRRGHVMPASQLPSQLATLEPLQPDEPGIQVPGASDVGDVLTRIEAALADHLAPPGC